MSVRMFCVASLLVGAPVGALPLAGQGRAAADEGMHQAQVVPGDDVVIATKYAAVQQDVSLARPKPAAASPSAPQPITVADVIQMTRVAGSSEVKYYYGGTASSDFAVFSPDGTRFVVVLKKGNLEQNTNDYWMLLFSTDQASAAPLATRLVTFASSSNREGIRDVSWLDDNDTILFVGERGVEPSQLYRLHCSTGKLEQLTRESRNVMTYAVSGRGERMVYGLEDPVTDLIAPGTMSGFTVTDQNLLSLITGRAGACGQHLFLINYGGAAPKPLQLGEGRCHDLLQLVLSPDGRYLLAETNLFQPPSSWRDYQDDSLQLALKAKIAEGRPGFVLGYMLVDTESGVSRPLLDAPLGYMGSEVGWSPDSQSVIVTGTHLPLNIDDAAQLAVRRKNLFTVEVKVPSLEVIQIADHDLKFIGWDPGKKLLSFRPSRAQNLSGTSAPLEYYRRQGSGWMQVAEPAVAVSRELPQIMVEQDLNVPPRIVAFSARSGRRRTLLDLNPNFHNLAFGRVEEISWTGGGGHQVRGGLYLPPGYVPGKRYPLVIQTHGFDAHGFWIDGPFTTAFAAQPLASKGIVVLQVPDSHELMETQEEAPRMMETYDKAIDYLDQHGVIDPSRVGIIGFSRTCLYVKYTLTHSKHRFAAASVADGVDAGYFQYIAFFTEPNIAESAEGLNGAAPFDSGLSQWRLRSPGFLLDRVSTPMRIQAIDSFGSILGEWEWFAGLSRLGKPVELIYLPGGTHILQRPQDRMLSQQGDVDWFCFWLKGEEASDAAKAEQFARWRKLRGLLDNTDKSPHANVLREP